MNFYEGFFVETDSEIYDGMKEVWKLLLIFAWVYEI